MMDRFDAEFVYGPLGFGLTIGINAYGFQHAVGRVDSLMFIDIERQGHSFELVVPNHFSIFVDCDDEETSSIGVGPLEGMQNQD